MGSAAGSRDSVRIESNCGTPVFFFFSVYFYFWLLRAFVVVCGFSLLALGSGYSSLWTSLVAQKVKRLATM